MDNFITVITYNIKDEQGNVINQAMRLVNAPSNVTAATVGQIMETNNWVDQVVVQRQAVNAVFPAPAPQTPAEPEKKINDTKSKKATAKKAKAGTKTTASKTKAAPKKKPGRPKSK
jgi:hypothetical protein